MTNEPKKSEPCPDCDERLCESCFEKEAAYWEAYFGGRDAIRARVASERFYREHAHELTPEGKVR